MSKQDRKELLVLFGLGCFLLGVLVSGWYFNSQVVKTWEDGSYVGCQHFKQCND